MLSRYFDFGVDLQLPELSVCADGRVTAPGGSAIAAPYFQWVSDEHPAQDEPLSHLLTAPFPGHEWNHFALYAIQRAPIDILRSAAYAGIDPGPPVEAQWRRANREVIEKSFGHLERMLRVYHSVFGGRQTKRITQAVRECLSSLSFVEAVPAEQADPPPPPERNDLAGDLDATYLHASFTREAFHAYLDIRTHEARGRNPDDYLLKPLSETPLLQRLLNLSSQAATRFIVSWHRKSYRFPRFTKRFFRSVAKLPVRHAKFGLSLAPREE